jgi:hypothetical protein
MSAIAFMVAPIIPSLGFTKGEFITASAMTETSSSKSQVSSMRYPPRPHDSRAPRNEKAEELCNG